MKKFVWSVMILLFCVTTMLCPVQAASQEMSGIIYIKQEDTESGKPVEGVRLALYQIAEMGNNKDYELTDVFSKIDLKVGDLFDNKKYEENINLLKAYIEEKKLPGNLTACSDAEGRIKFCGLSDGIYFITQISTQEDFENLGFTYTTEDYFVEMPKRNNDGTNTREIWCKPKGEISYPEKNMSLSVYKIWKDNNDKYEKRPEKITVGLYADGEKYSEIVLNMENNWTYKWENLNSKINWSVKELNIPNDYKSEIIKEDNEYRIVNTYQPVESVSKSVKTGDNMKILFWMMCLGISSSVFLIVDKGLKKDV